MAFCLLVAEVYMLACTSQQGQTGEGITANIGCKFLSAVVCKMKQVPSVYMCMCGLDVRGQVSRCLNAVYMDTNHKHTRDCSSLICTQLQNVDAALTCTVVFPLSTDSR